MRSNHLASSLGALLLSASALSGQEAPDSSRRAAPPAATLATPPTRAPGAYMNISFVGITTAGFSTARDLERLQVGDHDPRARGFSVPNAELSLDGAVDPYFKGVANIVHKIDADGETGVELEEMYVLTTALPGNLQLKVGQFFAEFGRQNPLHPHSWAFADEALVIGRVFGAEGLRSQGARLSWLLPLDVYTEASVAVMNAAGGTTSGFRSEESSTIHGGIPIDREVTGARELLYVPRVVTSFDITGSQTVLLGLSGAFGPNNTGADAQTSIVGADIYWKWKSSRARAGFPFVAFQSEVIARRYDAAARTAATDSVTALSAATLRDIGAYAQLSWGIRPMVVAALRAEQVRNDDASSVGFIADDRDDRTRYSTNLTWFPTEYSKFRVQYNYDRRVGIGNDSSLWLQLEFLLGSHAAHKF